MQLRLEFTTIKKGGESIMEYILKMKTVSDNLATVGEPVKKQTRYFKFLEVLDQSIMPLLLHLLLGMNFLCIMFTICFSHMNKG